MRAVCTIRFGKYLYAVCMCALFDGDAENIQLPFFLSCPSTQFPTGRFKDCSSSIWRFILRMRAKIYTRHSTSPAMLSPVRVLLRLRLGTRRRRCTTTALIWKWFLIYSPFVCARPFFLYTSYYVERERGDVAILSLSIVIAAYVNVITGIFSPSLIPILLCFSFLVLHLFSISSRLWGARATSTESGGTDITPDSRIPTAVISDTRMATFSSTATRDTDDIDVASRQFGRRSRSFDVKDISAGRISWHSNHCRHIMNYAKSSRTSSIALFASSIPPKGAPLIDRICRWFFPIVSSLY